MSALANPQNERIMMWNQPQSKAARSVYYQMYPPPQLRNVEILETFEGSLDLVEDGVAYLTIRSPQGEVLQGRYSAKELARRGISQGSRFHCSTVRTNKGVEVEFDLLARRDLTADELAQLNRDLDLGITDDDLADDY